MSIQNPVIFLQERVPNASFATMDLMCFIADIKEERSVLLPSIALLHVLVTPLLYNSFGS
jgi:hypothetical protein